MSKPTNAKIAKRYEKALIASLCECGWRKVYNFQIAWMPVNSFITAKVSLMTAVRGPQGCISVTPSAKLSVTPVAGFIKSFNSLESELREEDGDPFSPMFTDHLDSYLEKEVERLGYDEISEFNVYWDQDHHEEEWQARVLEVTVGCFENWKADAAQKYPDVLSAAKAWLEEYPQQHWRLPGVVLSYFVNRDESAFREAVQPHIEKLSDMGRDPEAGAAAVEAFLAKDWSAELG